MSKKNRRTDKLWKNPELAKQILYGLETEEEKKKRKKKYEEDNLNENLTFTKTNDIME